MKLRNVKVSPVFSIIIIVIVVSVFLLPSLAMQFSALGGKQREERLMASYNKALDDRVDSVRRSIAALEIKDRRLRQCVTNQAMELAGIHPRNSGGIDSVQELESLTCHSQGIVDISGLGSLRGLKYLNLQANRISDISPLAGLAGLETANLTNNNITDLEPLKSLKALRVLRLSGNRTLSVDVLASLPGLETVSLPEIAHIFCRDLKRLVNRSCFKVDNFQGYDNCKGQYNNRAARLITERRLGRELTLEEQAELLEYEINQMKDVPPRECE